MKHTLKDVNIVRIISWQSDHGSIISLTKTTTIMATVGFSGGAFTDSAHLKHRKVTHDGGVDSIGGPGTSHERETDGEPAQELLTNTFGLDAERSSGLAVNWNEERMVI